jgi:hypothetical protein
MAISTTLLRRIIAGLLFGLTMPSLAGADDKPAEVRPAQSAPTLKHLPSELVAFFSGRWKGLGKFANGKKIEATVVFSPDLDGQWLSYRHTDIPPGKYKASGFWGIETDSSALVMILMDNFGGIRLFTSDGWTDGAITFKDSARLPTAAGRAARQERFVFQRTSKTSFRMTYEFSIDGSSWSMGDYLDFAKGRLPK